MNVSEMLGYVGSMIAVLTVAQTMLQSLVPAPLKGLLQHWCARAGGLLTRYHFVEVPEYEDSTFLCNELYGAVKLHLSANVAAYTRAATRVRLCRPPNSSDFTWSPANHQHVPVTFEGARVWWEHTAAQAQGQQSFNLWTRGLPCGAGSDEKRAFTLKLLRRDKARILAPYMEHILKQAKEIRHHNRERFLYTNARSDSYRHPWDSVPFRHPSTFDTLALDPARKQEIRADLEAFSSGEDFYKRTGRAWKRGYLLYGPPGTGKSSLIAAMANLLMYDVYDLELTQVRSNSELRKLLLRTTSKSIIVIEDIDCSLDLAGPRACRPKPRKDTGAADELYKGSTSPHLHDPGFGGGGGGGDVCSVPSITLSGLLNFTDGLWSCCGEERIFVFTTNHIESLDPALLRSGRMDMHVLMSFCTFPAFKILAANYLGVDEHHPLMGDVQKLIDGARVTPAEVSEVLIRNREHPATALRELIAELELAAMAKLVKQGIATPNDHHYLDTKQGIMHSRDDDHQDCDVEQVKRAVLDNSNNEQECFNASSKGGLEDAPNLEAMECFKGLEDVLNVAGVGCFKPSKGNPTIGLEEAPDLASVGCFINPSKGNSPTKGLEEPPKLASMGCFKPTKGLEGPPNLGIGGGCFIPGKGGLEEALNSVAADETEAECALLHLDGACNQIEEKMLAQKKLD